MNLIEKTIFEEIKKNQKNINLIKIILSFILLIVFLFFYLVYNYLTIYYILLFLFFYIILLFLLRLLYKKNFEKYKYYNTFLDIF